MFRKRWKKLFLSEESVILLQVKVTLLLCTFNDTLQILILRALLVEALACYIVQPFLFCFDREFMPRVPCSRVGNPRDTSQPARNIKVYLEGLFRPVRPVVFDSHT